MKKLLTTLVTLTTAVTPVVTATNLTISSKLDANINYQPKNLQNVSKSLFSATNDDKVKVTISLGATYGDIDKTIYNTATVFKTKPLFGNYTVDYYKNSGDKATINNEAQATGDAYVIISADLHDPILIERVKLTI